jgi:hypothetical protein
MKTIRFNHSILPAIAALAVASMAGLNSARADYTIASFDTDISANDNNASPGGGLGGGTTTAWSSVNGPNGPAGGSEYVTVPWTGSGWQEVQLNFTQSGDLSMSTYINVEFDIKVDVANSHLGANGDYGNINPVLQNWDGNGSPGWDGLSGLTIKNTNGWQHMVYSVASFSGSINRLVIDFNSGGGDVSANCSYWIDNIVLTAPPLPPPTLMSPIPAPKQAGLTLLPATTGEYQRVMVYPNSALGNNFGWYGQATAGNPVSYSFTITNFPPVGHYTAQVFWIPVSSFEYNANDTSVDWNCTNDMVFTVSASGNSGLATNWNITMATKTNLSGANPNLTITNYAYNRLPLGTWTVTFNNNTDFTITAPDNSVVSASLPPDVAELVSGNAVGNKAMAPYFGVQPNDPQGIGLSTVFSNIKISGTSPTVNDNFNLGYLDTTNTWSILSDYPADVTVNSGDLAWYVSWNTPNDQGYSTLLAASSPKGVWQDLAPSSSWLLVNGNRYATITSTALQSTLGNTSAAYFRLIKRQFTQLQVLLPGETNSPNTLTGKTGIPMAFNPYDEVDVIINAVDSTYHIVNSTDALNIGASDTTATITTPTPALTGGTVTVPVYFGTSGSWMVTATDTTSTNIPVATSSSITIH